VSCGGTSCFGGGRWWVVVVLVVLVAAMSASAMWWATTHGWWAHVVGFGFFVVFQKYLPRAISTLSACVPRGVHLALGIGLFAGPAVPSALCQEFPLGTGCAESILLSAKAANPVM
jgi:hypothetical protein